MLSSRAALLLAVTCLAATAALAQPRRNELNATGVPPGDYGKTLRSAADMALPNNYERDETWLKFPKGRVLGATSALDIDKDGKSIWLAERCAGAGGCMAVKTNPIMKFDANGNLVRSFGAGLLVYPHGMWVDRDGNVWVADTQSNIQRNDGTPNPAAAGVKPAGNRVLKFSPTGKLLLQLGTTGEYGADNSRFNQPSDVITAPNGDIFVADGHELTNLPPRIMKFDKTGKFIKAWDLCSKSVVPFDCSHSLAMDSQGRIFVADRGNSLVVVYDQDGKRLAEWKQFGKPSGLYIDKNDVLYAGDSVSSVQEGNAFIRGVHIGSARTGEVTGFIPDVLGNPVPWFPLKGTTGPEGVVADAKGNIFVSQVAPFGQVARYRPKPN
jgi:streptogramin lyase